MKGKLRPYLFLPVFMAVILMGIDVFVIYMDKSTGTVLTILLIGFFVISIVTALIVRPHFNQSIVEFATGYGLMQRRLLEDFEIPYAILG